MPMEEERQVCTRLLGTMDLLKRREWIGWTSLGPYRAEQVCLAGFREEGPRS